MRCRILSDVRRRRQLSAPCRCLFHHSAHRCSSEPQTDRDGHVCDRYRRIGDPDAVITAFDKPRGSVAQRKIQSRAGIPAELGDCMRRDVYLTEAAATETHKGSAIVVAAIAAVIAAANEYGFSE